MCIRDSVVAENDDLKLNVPAIDSFVMDALGRAYLVSLDGPIYRLDPSGS